MASGLGFRVSKRPKPYKDQEGTPNNNPKVSTLSLNLIYGHACLTSIEPYKHLLAMLSISETMPAWDHLTRKLTSGVGPGEVDMVTKPFKPRPPEEPKAATSQEGFRGLGFRAYKA